MPSRCRALVSRGPGSGRPTPAEPPLQKPAASGAHGPRRSQPGPFAPKARKPEAAMAASDAPGGRTPPSSTPRAAGWRSERRGGDFRAAALRQLGVTGETGRGSQAQALIRLFSQAGPRLRHPRHAPPPPLCRPQPLNLLLTPPITPPLTPPSPPLPRLRGRLRNPDTAPDPSPPPGVEGRGRGGRL